MVQCCAHLTANQKSRRLLPNRPAVLWAGVLPSFTQTSFRCEERLDTVSVLVYGPEQLEPRDREDQLHSPQSPHIGGLPSSVSEAFPLTNTPCWIYPVNQVL